MINEAIKASSIVKVLSCLHLTNVQHIKFEFSRSNFMLLDIMFEQIDQLSNIKVRHEFYFCVFMTF